MIFLPYIITALLVFAFFCFLKAYANAEKRWWDK